MHWRGTWRIVCALTAAGTGGCAHVDRQHAAEEYQRKANETLAENDVRAAVLRQVRLRHRAILEIARQAMTQQKKIENAKFLGTVRYGQPQDWPKVWVAAVIEANGRVASVECYPDRETAKPDPNGEKLIVDTVTQWIFSPMMIEGARVPSINVFPAFTDGVEIYVSDPKELQ